MPLTGAIGHRGSAVSTLIPLEVSCTVSSIFTPGPEGFQGEGLVHHHGIFRSGRNPGIPACVARRPSLVVELPLLRAEAMPGVGGLDFSENRGQPGTRNSGLKDVCLDGCDPGFCVALRQRRGIETDPAGHVGHHSVAPGAVDKHRPAADRCMRWAVGA